MLNENRRRPERWRSEIEIAFRSAERFSPLEGTAFAGANCRGVFFFQAQPGFFF